MALLIICILGFFCGAIGLSLFRASRNWRPLAIAMMVVGVIMVVWGVWVIWAG